MQLGHVAIVGSGGLLGEILFSELQHHADITQVPDQHALAGHCSRYPDVIITWSTANEINELRAGLQHILPVDFDPLMVVINLADPTTYFTRLQSLRVERMRLGFDELITAIAARLTDGMSTTTPASAV